MRGHLPRHPRSIHVGSGQTAKAPQKPHNKSFLSRDSPCPLAHSDPLAFEFQALPHADLKAGFLASTSENFKTTLSFAQEKTEQVFLASSGPQVPTLGYLQLKGPRAQCWLRAIEQREACHSLPMAPSQV